jgi:hypothetical protein
VREPHLDLLAFPSRLLEALGASERPGNVPSVLMDVTRDLARWFLWTALRFEWALSQSSLLARYRSVSPSCTVPLVPSCFPPGESFWLPIEVGGVGYERRRRWWWRWWDEFKNNPELRLRAAVLTSLENPGAGPAVMESLMNRMIYSNRTMASCMSGGPKSFYGPARQPGMAESRMEQIRRNPAMFAKLDALTNTAFGGSNVVKGYTDQGSVGDPNYMTGGIGVNINRERFNLLGWRSPGDSQCRTVPQRTTEARCCRK